MNIEFLLALKSQLEKAMQEQQGGKIRVESPIGTSGTSNEEPRKACANQQECLEKRLERLEAHNKKLEERINEQAEDLEGLAKSILSLRDVIEVSIRLFKLAIDAKN